MDMLEDKREIEWIANGTEGGFWHKVGRNGCTKIVAYAEAGQCAGVPWFAVYNGDEIVWRMNGAFVDAVKYFEVKK